MKKIFTIMALLLTAAWVSNAQEAHRYGVKSGIITMENQMGSSTIYFDDYGAVETQKMKISMFDSEMEMNIIRKDGKTYMVNVAEKQVQEMPVMGAEVDFLNLTDQVKAQYKIKELGKETILDRECTKYSLEVSQMGQTMEQNVWVWKGITLKTMMDAGGFQMGNTAVKFEENVEIPASTFEVPKF